MIETMLMVGAFFQVLYNITSKEKQAMFTAKSQRDATPCVPFCVSGIFGPVPDGEPLGPEEASTGLDGGPTADGRAERSGGVDNDALVDDEGEDDKVDKNFRFDWVTYRCEWGDTQIDVAVTAMFAEYALLYARMGRLTTSSVPLPITMSEGVSMGQQATNFMNKFVTPILGKVTSTKVHKLLYHVIDAVHMHGNLQNCNTDKNESGHTSDKPFYSRTNGNLPTFTQQLVRRAHGTRAQLAKIDREDAAAVGANRAELARRAADAAETAAEAAAEATDAGALAAARDAGSSSSNLDAARAAAETADEVAATAAAASASAAVALMVANAYTRGGPSGAGATRRAVGGQAGTSSNKPYHLELISVSELRKRPGLAGAAAALGLSGDSRVRLVKRHCITARFDCRTGTKQMVRADPDVRGSLRFDAVFFRAPADPTSSRLAKLRAIVRRTHGDWARLSLLKSLARDPGFPLECRGCVRLQWHVRAGASDATLCAVPMTSVTRLAHIVPDLKELAEREGYDAVPPALDAPVEKRLAMRYYLNAFYTWEV